MARPQLLESERQIYVPIGINPERHAQAVKWAKENKTNFSKMARDGIDIVMKAGVKPKEQKEEKEYSEAVKSFQLTLLSYFPTGLNLTPADIKNWCETIDKLVRIDGKDKIEIESIVKWAREDSFWKNNFLSLTKLRKKNKENVAYWFVFEEQMKNTKSDTKEAGNFGSSFDKK